jgi:type III secretion system FlhB-like substrate exporter
VAQKELLEIAKEDVLAAWAVLENLAVSFDQIGAVFGQAKGKTCSSAQQHALQEAIEVYITPALVQAINEARLRLGQYIPDEEAEALSEHIAYWDYASLSKGQE